MFRMFVGDNKTGHSLTNKDLRYARIAIPRAAALEDEVRGRRSTLAGGTWTIPADYLGIVNFQAQVKTKTNANGSFVQMPVGSSQLTVTAS